MGSVDGGDWIRVLILVGLMLVVVVRVGWLGFGLMAVGWLGGGGGSGLCGSFGGLWVLCEVVIGG